LLSLRVALRRGDGRPKPDAVAQLDFGNACRKKVVLNNYNLTRIAVAYLDSF